MRWLLSWALLLAGCSGSPAPAGPPELTPPPPAASPSPVTGFQAPIWSYRVVNRYPHDPRAFTQGLLVGPGGTLYESTGRHGESELRLVELTSGRVLRRHRLEEKYFGEGLALCQGRLYQLTWQNGLGFQYAPANFRRLGTFGYVGEGWGLTTAPDQRLVLSNGSSNLTWRDPQTFREVARVVVKDGANPVAQLNELEWVEGRIYANLFMTSYIAIIEPQSGQVQAFLDLRGLLSQSEQAQADVLNGIAYDPKSRRLFVTGKLWPRLFEIQVVPGP